MSFLQLLATRRGEDGDALRRQHRARCSSAPLPARRRPDAPSLRPPGWYRTASGACAARRRGGCLPSDPVPPSRSSARAMLSCARIGAIDLGRVAAEMREHLPHAAAIIEHAPAAGYRAPQRSGRSHRRTARRNKPRGIGDGHSHKRAIRSGVQRIVPIGRRVRTLQALSGGRGAPPIAEQRHRRSGPHLDFGPRPVRQRSHAPLPAAPGSSYAGARASKASIIAQACFSSWDRSVTKSIQRERLNVQTRRGGKCA